MKPREKWMRVVDEETYALIVPGGVVLRHEILKTVIDGGAYQEMSETMAYIPMPGSFADQFVTSRLFVPADAFKSKPLEEKKP